jgi:hypothetical protein
MAMYVLLTDQLRCVMMALQDFPKDYLAMVIIALVFQYGMRSYARLTWRKRAPFVIITAGHVQIISKWRNEKFTMYLNIRTREDFAKLVVHTRR